MSREDIILMAKEAGLADSNGVVHAFSQLEHFAALVAEHEREACAKVCESFFKRFRSIGYTHLPTIERCAEAIRARGNT